MVLMFLLANICIIPPLLVLNGFCRKYILQKCLPQPKQSPLSRQGADCTRQLGLCGEAWTRIRIWRVALCFRSSVQHCEISERYRDAEGYRFVPSWSTDTEYYEEACVHQAKFRRENNPRRDENTIHSPLVLKMLRRVRIDFSRTFGLPISGGRLWPWLCSSSVLRWIIYVSSSKKHVQYYDREIF